jgi:hypothetical protein
LSIVGADAAVWSEAPSTWERFALPTTFREADCIGSSPPAF